MEETFFVTVNKLTLDLIDLIRNQDIDFIGLFLTNGQWNRTKKSYREKIAGPSGIQYGSKDYLDTLVNVKL